MQPIPNGFRLTPQNIALILATVLVVAGLSLLWKALSIPSQCDTCAVFDASLKDMKVATNHGGLAVITMGVALGIAALVGPALWTGKSRRNSN